MEVTQSGNLSRCGEEIISWTIGGSGILLIIFAGLPVAAIIAAAALICFIFGYGTYKLALGIYDGKITCKSTKEYVKRSLRKMSNQDLCFYCVVEDSVYHIDLNRYQSLDRPKGCLYPKEHGSQSSSSTTVKQHKPKYHN